MTMAGFAVAAVSCSVHELFMRRYFCSSHGEEILCAEIVQGREYVVPILVAATLF